MTKEQEIKNNLCEYINNLTVKELFTITSHFEDILNLAKEKGEAPPLLFALLRKLFFGCRSMPLRRQKEQGGGSWGVPSVTGPRGCSGLASPAPGWAPSRRKAE